MRPVSTPPAADRRPGHRAVSATAAILALPLLAGGLAACSSVAPDSEPASKEALHMRVEQGALEEGDATLESGELSDELTFSASAGEYVLLDLTSDEFDPYLILIAPDGTHFENDDYEGSPRRSLLGLELPQSGEYRVVVTSYEPGEKGRWSLGLGRDGGAAPAATSWVEEGELAEGDDTLGSGELKDDYFFDALPGQTARIELTSDELDTYLILISPSGVQSENDDYGDVSGDSLLDLDLQEAGTYRVVVTSYERQTGAYRLAVELGGSPSTVEQSHDVVALDLGSTVRGRLEPGDTEATDGSHMDLYVFRGEAGQGVSIEMRSADVDTYLELYLPDGTFLSNDDGPGGIRAPSRIELQLPETGRYRLAATSYEPGEVGDYELGLAPVDPALLAPYPAGPGGAPGRQAQRGRLFALLVGISDYGGRLTDLDFTADDAHRLYDALVTGAGLDPADAVLLTDSGATVGAVETAVTEIASRMGPDDLFVFFYSGHGNRLPRLEPQPADPDGRDESLSLYDDELSDDDLAALLGRVRNGRTLVALDSCFSGGFAKDVISVPGRMGLFSSEEDVTSQVADKFRAGGYLAYFLADALTSGYADDGDGQLTTLELSQYVYERYRGDVKSGSDDDVVMVGSGLGYQHLVVDRGSLSPFETLFWLR